MKGITGEGQSKRGGQPRLATYVLVATASLAMPDPGRTADAYSHHAGLGSAECESCHVPSLRVDSGNTPVWHSAATVLSYAPYAVLGAEARDSLGGAGSSSLCLACHDGTVAASILALVHSGGRSGFDIRAAAPLEAEHPVGVVYDSALARARGDLADPAIEPSGLGGTIASDLLVGGRLECASCHGLHGDRPEGKLLVMNNVGSALCLTCHRK